jgi:hypothetical protein
MDTLPNRLIRAAEDAADSEFNCACGAAMEAYSDASLPDVVVAVLRELAKVAPGTPEYAVEFDFGGLADVIERGDTDA